MPKHYKISSLHFSISLIVIFFIPVLFSGLYHDDRVLNVSHYFETHSIASAIWSSIIHWWDLGRVFPINVVLYETVSRSVTPDSYFSYHFLQLLSISLSYSLLIAFAVSETKDTSNAFVLLSFLLSCAAINPLYHDPFVSYHFQQPIFTLVFLSSVYFFDKYLDDFQQKYLVSSAILYVLALLTYEVAYPLIAIYLFQIAYKRPRSTKLWLGYGSLFTVLFVLQLLVRQMAPDDGYSGAMLSFAPMPVISTFIHQILASIPLSWFWGRSARFVFSRTEPLHLAEIFYILAFLAVAAFFVYSLIKTFRERNRLSYLSFIGLLVWLLPAIPIALSAKYQDSLTLMKGYLPRYLQTFGLAIFVSPLLYRFEKRRLLILIFSILALITFAYNVQNINKANSGFNAFRIIFYTLLETHFLEDQGTERMYLNRAHVYSPEKYLRINPNVKVILKEPLREGDKVLLIHPGAKGREWGYWGTWHSDDSVTDLYLIKNRKAFETSPADAILIKDWYFVPRAETRTMEELQASLE